MKKDYWILFIVFLCLGLLAAILPEKNIIREKNPEELLLDIVDDTRFLSTDEIAAMIIEENPSLFLVDVRTAEDFKEFSLPGSINIPLDDILNDNWAGYLDQSLKKVVFYSNGTIYANQAWMLCHRKGYRNNYVMHGGLNAWVENILDPKEPREAESDAAFDRYEFRKGAAAFFRGSDAIINSPDTRKALPVKRRVTQAAQGGC